MLSRVPTNMKGTIPCKERVQGQQDSPAQYQPYPVSYRNFPRGIILGSVPPIPHTPGAQRGEPEDAAIYFGKQSSEAVPRTSSLGFFLSLSPSTRTLTTPDLSTISWITFPFFPITLPE